MRHQSNPLNAILEQRDSLGVISTETYAPVLRPREVPLASSGEEMESLIKQLEDRCASQLHCSYFGNPTALFRGPSSDAYQSLMATMGGPEEMARYYGDLTGDHVVARACQEYELAVRAGLGHYTVHFGIDYSFCDGMYSYPETYGLDREAVLDGAFRQTVVYLNRFESHLAQVGLLTPERNLPTIGIENAGWGLEYGIQTADDYRRLFRYLEKVNAPLRELVTIDWDFNHLLHPLGRDKSGRASFMLPEEERSDQMRALERARGELPGALAAEWIRVNVFAEDLVSRVRCIHLSDSSWKDHAIFARCQAVGPYLDQLREERNPEARAALGEELVVSRYDNHLHLGSPEGMLESEHIGPVLRAILKEVEDRVQKGAAQFPLRILHELKGYPYQIESGDRPQERALQAQVEFLRGCGVFFAEALIELRE
ncbi:MAG: hypothetical protein RL518_1618 [Pseudomonadota bacterium]|jgi:hypothetical protein